jgi:hypothetical protein
MTVRCLRFALVAAGLILGAPASAIDLTGTWAAQGDTIRCKIQSNADTGFVQQDGNIVELEIVQVGEQLWIRINPGDAEYENKFLGYVFTSPKADAKGYGVATSCTVAGKFYAGAMRIVKAKVDGERGTLTIAYTGTRLGTSATCKGTYARTATAAPAIPLTCP